jgi:predicted nuclease with TOPRIM domain
MFSIFSNVTNSSNFLNSINILMGTLSIGQITFGIISWFIYDEITSIGYISSGIFTGITLRLLNKIKLYRSMQQSVNTLKMENDELKENNDELKENIDDLESISNKLDSDLTMLKNIIGLLDKNSEDVLQNLREIYSSLKKENEIHSKLNKNMIHINILQIIRHFDTSTTFSLKLEDLENAKKTLLNAFPNLNYNLLLQKIKLNNRITAKNIYESIKNTNNNNNNNNNNNFEILLK